MTLAESITELFTQGTTASKDAARELFTQLRAQLSAGRVRAAEPDPEVDSQFAAAVAN